jgi:DNA ligase D-like protein (predicted ligase)
MTTPSGWIQPMLAELTKTSPEGPGWVYERKLDGLRCIAVKAGDRVDLWSRSQLSFSARFPGLVEAIAAVPAERFVVDGEIVAMAGGQTSFSLLQRPGSTAVPEFHVFDILSLLGTSTTDLPLTDRKALLARTIPPDGPLHLVEDVTGDAEKLLNDACAAGWEGLIAKRAAGIYVSGRSSDWRKLKCSASQELVIAGWTEPRGSRLGFGALLVGHYDAVGLRYAGKVGTGFDEATLRSLHDELLQRERTTSPFVDAIREKGAHWAEPDLVANIAFTEWTEDGKLRHPRFEGLRPDKSPTSVRREA